MSLRLLACLGFSCSVGCGTVVTETPLNAAPRELTPRAPESVEVYSSAPPSRPHVDVALLEAEQSELGSGGGAVMVRRLRERAGKMGCDAVFISGISTRDGEPHGSDLYFLDPGSRSVHATCIAYVDPKPLLQVAPVSSVSTRNH